MRRVIQFQEDDKHGSQRFATLGNENLNAVSGGTDEVKGSPTYNPLTSCPHCNFDVQSWAIKTGIEFKFMDFGYMKLLCPQCYKAFYFDESGNIQTEYR